MFSSREKMEKPYEEPVLFRNSGVWMYYEWDWQKRFAIVYVHVAGAKYQSAAKPNVSPMRARAGV